PTPPALTEEMLREALGNAAAAGRSAVEELAETSGLSGDDLARALGEALHYPVLEGAVLMALAPAFDLLGPAEAAQRGCVMVRRDKEFLAVMGDPFSPSLRGWLELKVSQPFTWYLAAPGEITAYLAKYEQDLRALDVARVNSDSQGELATEVEN